MQITVVGSGIVGLNAACRLADAGHDVRIVSARRPLDTTSAIAAAIWYPYRAFPERDVTRWSAVTYTELTALAETEGTGVRMRAGRELFRATTPDPWWMSAVPGMDRVDGVDLPDGYADGFRLSVPVIDMSVHLEWLAAQAAARGIAMENAVVRDLDAVAGEVVVNCTGLGSRELVPDASMVPVRGQVVVVEQFGLDEWTLDDSDDAQGWLTYVVPREDTVVLGGTAQESREDLVPQPEVAARIIERCAALVPGVASAKILRHRVGLRPTRPAVRLEREVLASGRPVIHCYGHGGAGVTMARGCAAEIVALVD